jgi:hypothetical protein
MFSEAALAEPWDGVGKLEGLQAWVRS